MPGMGSRRGDRGASIGEILIVALLLGLVAFVVTISLQRVV